MYMYIYIYIPACRITSILKIETDVITSTDVSQQVNRTSCNTSDNGCRDLQN